MPSTAGLSDFSDRAVSLFPSRWSTQQRQARGLQGPPPPRPHPAPAGTRSEAGMKPVCRHACGRTVHARAWLCSSGAHGRLKRGALRMWSGLPGNRPLPRGLGPGEATSRLPPAVTSVTFSRLPGVPWGKTSRPSPGLGTGRLYIKRAVTHISLLLASNLIR